jgi:hypothetical protein
MENSNTSEINNKKVADNRATGILKMVLHVSDITYYSY